MSALYFFGNDYLFNLFYCY